MATRSSILAWRVPWTEEPGGPQSMGSQLDTTERLPLLLLKIQKEFFFWPRRVFVAVGRLSLLAVSRDSSGVAVWRLLLLRTGSRHVGSGTVAHKLSCPSTCGIFLEQGSNPCPLRWRADS